MQDEPIPPYHPDDEYEDYISNEVQGFLDELRDRKSKKTPVEIPVNSPMGKTYSGGRSVAAFQNTGRLSPEEAQAAINGTRGIVAVSLIFTALVVLVLYLRG